MTKRDVIKPQVDVPIVIKLDRGPEGRETAGQFGTQYQYTVNDDSAVLWLPPQGREALLRSGATAGDSVQLLKLQHGKATQFVATKTGAGAGSARTWDELQAYEDAPPPEPARSIRILAPAPPPAPPSYSNGNGHANGHANGNGSTPRPERPSSLNTMARAMSAAVDLILSTQEYARKAGLALDEATVEDVRTIAITLYIDARKESY